MLYSNFKLTTSSGKHLEDVSHTHIVPLMYKLITSSKDSDDISIGFDRNRGRRQDELTETKNVKKSFILKLCSKTSLVLQNVKKATYGLGYKLTLTRSKDEAFIDKAPGVADARIKIDPIHWYVPHYTPSVQQQSILSNQILS